MTLAEVAEAVSAVPQGVSNLGVEVSGVATDSRRVGAGDLFVAIAGERHDGHDHGPEAVQAGAVGVLAARAIADVPTLVVTDPVVAMGRLAHHLLERLGAHGAPTVVAVTGSVGKTSTKDLLGQVLGRLGPTVLPPGSFNNEIGLPATVLECEPATRYVVLELGARGIGHIRYLTGIAPPTIGVVLGVGTAHLGEFGSREAIAQAKGELVEALPAAHEGGVAVLNADDPLVLAMAARTTAKVRTFGRHERADVRADQVHLDAAARASFRLSIGDESVPVTLQSVGAHAVVHALAGAAVADAVGMPLADIGAALGSAVQRSPGRMSVSQTAGGVTVIDDSYNASPESVAAALEALATIAGGSASGAARRSWAVLGEMRELGEQAEPAHEQVGRQAYLLGVRCLVTVGEGAAGIHRGALAEAAAAPAGPGQGRREAQRAVFVPTAEDALRLVRQQLRPGDIVLVKASRTIGLERVAAGLLAAEPGGPPHGQVPQ